MIFIHWDSISLKGSGRALSALMSCGNRISQSTDSPRITTRCHWEVNLWQYRKIWRDSQVVIDLFLNCPLRIPPSLEVNITLKANLA